MTDPIFIEKAFKTLMSALPGLHSKREQLFAISDFLELIRGNSSAYSGYVEQILPLIPDFDHVYEITGIDPVLLKEVHETLSECLPKSEETEIIQIKIKAWATKAYEWVGVRDIYGTEDALIIFDSKLPVQGRIHTVLVPVVESRSNNSKGRLRNLVVKSIGNTPGKDHELTKLFSVLGSEQQVSNKKSVEQASNKLLHDLQLNKKQRWQSTASFEHNDAWHSGNSADLAMAGLFFCSILEAMDLKEQFRLNPAIAITGELNSDGKVGKVSDDTIKSKLEAVFFSWTQIMVVPEEQISAVCGIYDDLKQKYPNRDLIIIGVRQLRELFYDRRLTLHSKKSTIEHARNRLWKKKFSAIAIAVYVIMALTILALTIGPIDNNPVTIEYAGTKMILQNQFGNEVFTIDVGEDYVINATNPPPFEMTMGKIVDLDSDGSNEFLWKNKRSPEEPREIIYAGNIHGDTLWTFTYGRDLEYVEHDYVEASEYSFRQIEFEDLDNDGTPELIISANHGKYFPSIIMVVDPLDGTIKSDLLHHGHISLFQLIDVNNDGHKDVVFGGLDNANKIGFLSVITQEEFMGQVTISENYTALDVPVIDPIFYIQFPQSEVARIYANRPNFLTQMRSIIQIDSGKITVGVAEFLGNHNGRNDEIINLQYNFDMRLILENVASIDDYDLLTRELYSEGLIDFQIPSRYLASFKDSLLYWDGTEFVNTPTMNQKFLEVIGADSTSYLEWFAGE